MKKLQLTNIIIIGLLIILLSVFLISTLLALPKSIIIVLISLFLLIIEIIYFITSIKFYNSLKNQNKVIITACWLNISIPLIYGLFLFLAWNTNSPSGDDMWGAGVMILAEVIDILLLVLSFTLFFIGKHKANLKK